MQKITVDKGMPKSKGYDIHIGAGALERIGDLFDFGKYSNVLIVTDTTIESLLLSKLNGALPIEAEYIILPNGETEKTVGGVQKVWEALHKMGADRQTLLINLGGGVVGDLGGFAASTYMRGIDFLNVPTTLLSQVDSSIGGKTGINFAGIKNLIGTFNLPAGIVIDPRTLKSLPERELAAGFGEVIKHGLVWDKAYFEKVTAKPPQEFTEDELADIVEGSCRIKLAIIADDLHEGGKRKLVNFGHTIGHAVEALSYETESPLLHGEAVSVGMVAEATISAKNGTLPAADLERVKQALQNAGLPVAVSGLDETAIRDKMQSDKKNTGGKLNFTLLEAIGKATYNQQVPAPVVTEAIQAILD